MAIRVDYYERRDGASREKVGEVALAMCRAMRGQDGVLDARFYWAGADTVVVQTRGETEGALAFRPSPEMAKVVFGMGDLARQVRSERWTEPREGEEAYRLSR